MLDKLILRCYNAAKLILRYHKQEDGMDRKLIIYHGSQEIIEVPEYGKGKEYNDYGRGFYCTETEELAKEWACPVKKDGYANKYELNLAGLNVMHLTEGTFNILNWLAILLKNRKFDITSNVGNNAREYILEHFLPDITGVDVMIGYRADDSYFSFAEDFVNNGISVRDLNLAMRLGALGEQVVLISKTAFERIKFKGYETADYRLYYSKRFERDKKARLDYQNRKKTLSQMKDDLFIIDIMRGGIENDDPRLQSNIFG